MELNPDDEGERFIDTCNEIKALLSKRFDRCPDDFRSGVQDLENLKTMAELITQTPYYYQETTARVFFQWNSYTGKLVALLSDLGTENAHLGTLHDDYMTKNKSQIVSLFASLGLELDAILL
jgi:hypothetical protein